MIGQKAFLTGAAALLAIAACDPSSPDEGASNRAASPAAPARRASNVATSVPRSVPTEPVKDAASARRCGWLHNPTPGNWWLVDREGQWILGTQGGAQAPGLAEMPDMSTAGWVEANGHYGYGCACMTLTVDPSSRKVLAIVAPKPAKLAQCRADKALPSP